VWAGLEVLVECQPEIVCVHDAARPLTAKATVLEVIEAARRSGAATVASRPVDSIREDDGQDGTSRALDRQRLWMVETPQAFSFDLLHRAHQRARATGLKASDDAALVEACGEVVEVVESGGPNFKVTWPHDLDLLALLLGREP
jgi:2-C-methyl-D-erythritol 4-phosphate cytidylyltransferase